MIADILLPLGLAFIMFAMGLALTLADFKVVAARPRAVALGLACQMALLPVIAFLVVAGFGIRPDFAIGLMILAACPGGITSNLLTHLAGGATALSVSLTAITSIAGVLTVPVVVNLALAAFGDGARDLSVAPMVLGVFAVSTLPLLAGMAVRAWAPVIAGRIAAAAQHIATALFALIVVGAFASQWRVMMENFAEVLPPAVVLNVVGMAAAAALARAVSLERAERIAVVLETGMQNGALAIFVAATLLGSSAMMVPGIIYALAMNLSAVAFIAVLRLRRVGRMTAAPR